MATSANVHGFRCPLCSRFTCASVEALELHLDEQHFPKTSHKLEQDILELERKIEVVLTAEASRKSAIPVQVERVQHEIIFVPSSADKRELEQKTFEIDILKAQCREAAGELAQRSSALRRLEAENANTERKLRRLAKWAKSCSELQKINKELLTDFVNELIDDISLPKTVPTSTSATSKLHEIAAEIHSES